jgi:tRNA A37 threonylcarbamoyladenosine modification protein TsaB
VLRLWAQIAADEQRLAALDADRQKVYKAQQQIQGNMGALGTAGKEGALRAQYVDQLQAGEEQLKGIGEQEAAVKAEIERLKQEVDAKLRAL